MNAPDDERIERLRRAVVDEGPRPERHRATMERHRREWPTLWAALDALLAEPSTYGRTRDEQSWLRLSTFDTRDR